MESYKRMLEALKRDSAILNPGSGAPGAYSLNLSDKSALQSLLLERQVFVVDER